MRKAPSQWCVHENVLAEWRGAAGDRPARVGLVLAVHPGGANKVKLQWRDDGTRSDWLAVEQLCKPSPVEEEQTVEG